jgi:hypothetical protein
MKRLLIALVLIIPCLRTGAQINSYGEFALSVGTGKYLQDSERGFHLGGTAHALGGLQYGVVALNLGLGFIMLSDFTTEPYYMTDRTGRHLDLDFPVGMALRFPLDKAIIAFGADFSGFIGGHSTPLLSPHLDLLFAGKRVFRGIFLKGFTYLKQREPGYRPQYFGIGFRTTLG